MLGFGLTAASLGGCVEPWRGSGGDVAFCASALVGALHSVPYVLSPVAPGDEPWGAASLSARGRLRVVGPLSLEAGVELVVPITRDQFGIGSSSATAYQEAPVAGWGSVGVAVSIP